MPIIVSVCMCVRLYVCQCVRVCTKNTPIEMRFVSRPLEVPLLWLIKVGNHPITPNYPAITQPIRAKLAQGAGWICQGVMVSSFREHVYRVFREITA